MIKISLGFALGFGAAMFTAWFNDLNAQPWDSPKRGTENVRTTIRNTATDETKDRDAA